MIQDVKKYIAPYVAFSDPVPYKEINIYPVLMENYYDFITCVEILLIDKNKIPDIKVIQMSYLKFVAKNLLCDTTTVDDATFSTMGEFYSCMFYALFSMVLHVDVSDMQILIDPEDKVFFQVKEAMFTAADFDEIKKIILYQNMPDYDDTPMSDDFRRVVEEYYSVKNKNIIAATIEDKIDVVMSQTSYTEENIKNMTYRRFCRIFEKILSHTEYVVGCNGYTRKTPPEHWVYKTKKDKYADVFNQDKFNELQNN